MSLTDNPKLAVLIDADNASASLAKELLEEVAKFGVATVKRAYGDWTSQHLVGWKEALNRHAIQPIQQFAYTRGKNSTDASLIIDAMDLLYADNVDGFCLVSSDSDFTRLATRLRESRKVVYGLGERKTPEAFRAACDRFVFFEVLKRGGPSVDASTREPAPINDVPDLEQSLRQAFDAVSRDNGWATVSSVGSYMAKNNPSFDTRLYGFRKLSDMIRKQPFVEVMESTDANGGPLLAIRLKPRGGRDAPPPSRGHARGRNDAPRRDRSAEATSDAATDAKADLRPASTPAPDREEETGPPVAIGRADSGEATPNDDSAASVPAAGGDGADAAPARPVRSRRPRGRKATAGSEEPASAGAEHAAAGPEAESSVPTTARDADESSRAPDRAPADPPPDPSADATPAAAKRPRRKRG